MQIMTFITIYTVLSQMTFMSRNTRFSRHFWACYQAPITFNDVCWSPPFPLKIFQYRKTAIMQAHCTVHTMEWTAHTWMKKLVMCGEHGGVWCLIVFILIALSPKGALLWGPGPYRDLFGLCVKFQKSLFWVPILAAGGPYWVPISKLGGPY